MRVYVAGPMTGLPEHNYPAFHDAADRWREAGHLVLNPAELDQPDPSAPVVHDELALVLASDYYKRDIGAMLQFRVEAVAVLPGWQSSIGAQLEVTCAKAFGWPVYRADLSAWLPVPVAAADLILTLDEYQRNAAATMAMDLDSRTHRAVMALGIAGEAGEVADLVKKEVGHGHPEDPERVQKEVGDVLWYAAGVAGAYGQTLGDVARANARKLATRYPGGFTTERSLDRLDLRVEDGPGLVDDLVDRAERGVA